ncbi:MAG TPA: hypothetical protein PLK90_01800 [Clostridiales bacterium]|nr:hypothetical protein [Clostridiales bacterium]HQP69109.1 hypothetical protein [Clostridiales bacterium]
MLKKNGIIEYTAASVNHFGEAEAVIDNCRVIVPKLLAGEIAEVKIIKAGKNISFGKIVNVKERSISRIDPICLNGSCDSCELKCADYNYQLQLKTEWVSSIFGRKIEISGSNQFGYRNKIVLPVKRVSGKFMIGTYKKNSHDISDWTHSCRVVPEGINSIIRTVRQLVEKYDEKGSIEQLYIRGGSEGYQAGFIIKSGNRSVKLILDALYHADQNIVSTFYSASAGTNSVIVKEPVYTNGTGTVLLKTDFATYRMFPTAFFQANIYTLNKILKAVRAEIIKSPDEKILDLYSGCGVLSDHPGIKRTCVESNGSAFGSIEKNELTEFVVSDASGIINGIDNDDYGIIIADPPRKGICANLISAVNSSKAHTFIYLSCEPETQKRDIDLLTNYYIENITAYDMFPNTVHIESLAILKRK